jgi:hypothetical protein
LFPGVLHRRTGPGDGDWLCQPRALPRPALRTNTAWFGTMPVFARPISVYDPLEFRAHAAQITPARITVIGSTVVAARVSSVCFQARPSIHITPNRFKAKHSCAVTFFTQSDGRLLALVRIRN